MKGKNPSWEDLPDDLRTKLEYIVGRRRVARPQLTRDAAINQGLHVVG
jgi:hypothetical protein